MNKSSYIKNASVIFFSLLMMASLSCHAAISIAQIFKSPLIGSAALRPDGKAVLLLKEENKIQYLSIKLIANGEEKKIFTPSTYGAAKSIVGQIIWLDNRYFAINFFEPRAGIEDLTDTKISRRLLIVDSQAVPDSLGQVLSVKTAGWLVNALPAVEGEFLYAKSGIQSYVYKLKVGLLGVDKAVFNKSEKVDGGQFIASNQVVKVDGYVTRWFSRKNGEFKSALHFTAPYELSLTEFGADGKQEKVFSWSLRESNKKEKKEISSVENYIPLATASSAGEYYCLDRTESESKSLYLVNFKNKTHKLIYETDAYKIVDLMFSPEDKLEAVQVLKNERLSIEPISEAPVAGSSYKGILALTINTSVDLSKKLIYEESYNQSGEYWLETQASGARVTVGKSYPWLTDKLKSKQVESEVNVDGLSIPYILNLPASNGASPLIVMPHGGPIGVFDSPYFDKHTQLLNAQGYAVLRVNFRGSGGRNKEYREAGKKEWGGLILKDIHQATVKVLERSDLDKSRVCLFGMSYGGYATAMLLIKHPDVYKCGVAVAGVYDLNLYLQSPQFSEAQDKWAKEYVGNHLIEYDALKSISPIFLAEELQKPLLLLHGSRDDVVDIEQSARLKFSMDKVKKPVSFIKLDDMGHSINSVEDAEKLLVPSLEFFRANL